MQKVEARRWNYTKESFLEYSMDKLALIHNLNLSQDSTIHLLISGIGSRSLREIAASLKVDSVDLFLESMYRITSVSGETDSKLLQTNKNSKSKELAGNCGSCGKSGHLQKNCKNSSFFCAYCKTPGHLRADCFKLKREEQAATSAQTAPVAAVSATGVIPKDEETVAVVQFDNGRNLTIPDALAKITRLNMKDCLLFALVDTDSPISFIKSNVHKKFLDYSVEFQSPSGFSKGS
ncbi:uncharacterized protein LOC115241419 [Formica exsecta]|uniref:uncharacterized protein LOC115241419 n=1 Tax=Formica exsecta TaxID=72781 RepID=UPI001141144A|nr:uncharacterized protein LOC115241419 [Formica exsecta]